MKKLSDQIIASTSSLSSKPISENDLKNLFVQMPDPCIFNQSHDESLPPAGKGYNKKLIKLQNGDLAITMDFDIYDESLEINPGGFSPSSTHKEYRDNSNRNPEVKVLYDEQVFKVDYWKDIINCSDEEVCISCAPKIDRHAEVTIITVITIVSFALLRGFFEEVGKEAYRKLKAVLSSGAVTIQKKKLGRPSFHFKSKYIHGSNEVEKYS